MIDRDEQSPHRQTFNRFDVSVSCGLQEWRAIIMGLMAILVITPVLSFACIRVPLQPFEFRVGLTVFSVAPTTLSQGLTLVRGNWGCLVVYFR